MIIWKRVANRSLGVVTHKVVASVVVGGCRYAGASGGRRPLFRLKSRPTMTSGRYFYAVLIFDELNRHRTRFGGQHGLNINVMAMRELSSTGVRLSKRAARPSLTSINRHCGRHASSEAGRDPTTQELSKDLQELESASSYFQASTPAEDIKAYDPIKRAQGRRRQLPPSRYAN